MLNLKGVNLYLVGMMGSGKSTTGRLVAEQLQYRFFDTDDLITQLAGSSINQIFAESGEATFRRLETQVLAELSPYTNLVIATGGGIVLEPLNWSYLHQGLVVWLDVPVDRLWTRLQGDTTRPLLSEPDPCQTLKTLYQHRQPLYAQADVHVTIQADQTPEQVIQQMVLDIAEVCKQDKDFAG